jgi:hypothetical protein
MRPSENPCSALNIVVLARLSARASRRNFIIISSCSPEITTMRSLFTVVITRQKPSVVSNYDTGADNLTFQTKKKAQYYCRKSK